MPPKQAANGSTGPKKHQYTTDERDAMQILFYEYDLNPKPTWQDALRIFEDMFPWTNDSNPDIKKKNWVKVRDEWRTRRSVGKSTQWANVSSKPFTNYTAGEQANRAQVRVRVLQAARNVGITLTPNAAVPEVTALHAAAVATLNAGGGGVGVPPAALPQQPPQQPPSQPPPQPARQRQQPPRQSQRPSRQRQQAPSQPPRQPSRQPSQGPGTPGGNPTTSPTTSTRVPVAERDDILYMVHQSEAVNIVNPNGDSAFSWTREQVFGPEDPVWSLGGFVVQALIRVNPDNLTGYQVEDIMVCQTALCGVCAGANVLTLGPESGRQSDTGGLPFVHSASCVPMPDGRRIFNTPLDAPVPVVAHEGIEYREVFYTRGAGRLEVTSAICISGRCPQCSATGPQTGAAGGGGNDQRTLPAGTGPGIGTRRPGDDSLDGPDPQRRRLEPPLPGNATGVTGETGTGSWTALQMVHWNDINANVGNTGQPIPGQPEYQTNITALFGSEQAIWRGGGVVMNLLVLDGDVQSERNVMICESGECASCAGLNYQDPFGSLGGGPTVHAIDCDPRFTGSIFRPAWNSQAAIDATEGRRVQRPITFSIDGRSVIITAKVCIPDQCSFCGPALRTAATASTSTTTTRLKMVHHSDVTPNTDAGGNPMVGEPRNKALFESLFDGTSNDTMWAMGGPVMNIFIPGDEGGREDADWHVMVCNVFGCQHCQDAPNASYPSGIIALADPMLRYRGRPAVHSRDLIQAPSTPIFQPQPSRGFGEIMVTATESFTQDVAYFEGGERIVQSTAVCRPETCPLCAPPDVTMRSMVHRKDLQPMMLGSMFALLAGDQARYSCQQSDVLGPDEAELYRGGPVVRIFISDDGILETRDVMLCQYQSCTKCVDDQYPTLPYTTHRLPFVHKRDCTEGVDTQSLLFQPRPNMVLPKRPACAVRRMLVRYDRIDYPAVPRSVLSAVCVQDTCPECSAPDPEAGIRQQNTDTDSHDGGQTASPPVPLPPATPGTTNATGANPTPAPTTTGTTAPPAPAGPGLRMCHQRHLNFDQAQVYWGVQSKAAGKPGLVNQYFVPTTLDCFDWGGPTFRVDFPDGTQQDVMSCRTVRCKACSRRNPNTNGVSTNGRPFVHRRELTAGAGAGAGAGSARTFTPVPKSNFSYPAATVPFTLGMVTFPQGTYPTQTATTVQAEICVEGDCVECDGDDDEDDDGDGDEHAG